jgi:hypothetical protein
MTEQQEAYFATVTRITMQLFDLLSFLRLGLISNEEHMRLLTALVSA